MSVGGDGEGTTHAHVPGFLRGLIAALAVGLLLVFVWPHLVSRLPPDPTRVPELVEAGKYLEAEHAIDWLLNRAVELSEQDKRSQARKLLEQARDLAHDARTRVMAARQHKLANDLAARGGAESGAARARLLLQSKQEYPFSMREADACYQLAGMAFRDLRRKYAAQLAGKSVQRFVPPTAETGPIRREIMRGLGVNPDHKRLYRLLGVLDNMTGRFGSAEKALLKATRIDERFAEAYNDLGLVYVNQRRFEQARDAFEKALLAADKPEVKAVAEYNLGMFHADLLDYYAGQADAGGGAGDRQRARQHSESAVKYLRAFLEQAPPGSPDAVAARRKLSRVVKATEGDKP